jgi:peptidoglycan/xylan/chitin deacetylase (PgdA/CDA1 family)
MGAARQLIRSTLEAAVPRSLFMVSRPAGSAVCLTFDDGPDPAHTPPLLDMLAAHGVAATFFVVGRQAEKHPEIVRRMAREGHSVGHHSFTHSEPSTTSAKALLEEVRRTSVLIGEIVGAPPCLFRPPNGKVTAAKLWGLWRAKQTVVLWNVDPKDFSCTSAEELRDRFARRPLADGDIVLLHDNVPFAALVLPQVIAAVRARGLDFAALCS